MSFSKVDAKVVRRACLAYLSRRDTNIKKRREKLIEKEMSRRSIMDLIFRRQSQRTRGEAIRNLEAGDSFGPWFMLGFSGVYWAEIVDDVLALANASGDGFVSISSKHMSALGNDIEDALLAGEQE